MPGITNTLANDMLTRASSLALFTALHQGDPGVTGANEISLSSYDRRPNSWQAPASGQLKIIAAGIPFRVPGVASISHWSWWTQASAGTFLGAGSFTTCEVFVNPGTLTVTSLNYTLPII